MKLVAHMDHSNAQTFEVADLEKLIKQVCLLKTKTLQIGEDCARLELTCYTAPRAN